MGINIISLNAVKGSDLHRSTITHNGNTLEAVVVGEFERVKRLSRTDVIAEFELNEIQSAECGLERDDCLSGIFPLEGGRILIDGSIHNEIEIGDSIYLFDIYIQNGADCLAVTTDEIGERPSVGSRIRIVGKGLRVFPTYD